MMDPSVSQSPGMWHRKWPLRIKGPLRLTSLLIAKHVVPGSGCASASSAKGDNEQSARTWVAVSSEGLSSNPTPHMASTRSLGINVMTNLECMASQGDKILERRCPCNRSLVLSGSVTASSTTGVCTRSDPVFQFRIKEWRINEVFRQVTCNTSFPIPKTRAMTTACVIRDRPVEP